MSPVKTHTRQITSSDRGVARKKRFETLNENIMTNIWDKGPQEAWYMDCADCVALWAFNPSGSTTFSFILTPRLLAISKLLQCFNALLVFCVAMSLFQSLCESAASAGMKDGRIIVLPSMDEQPNVSFSLIFGRTISNVKIFRTY